MMPFSLISTVLGVGFALVWVLVAMMLLRVGQGAARQDGETQSG
jgi:hypothetical protein